MAQILQAVAGRRDACHCRCRSLQVRLDTDACRCRCASLPIANVADVLLTAERGI